MSEKAPAADHFAAPPSRSASATAGRANVPGTVDDEGAIGRDERSPIFTTSKPFREGTP